MWALYRAKFIVQAVLTNISTVASHVTSRSNRLQLKMQKKIGNKTQLDESDLPLIFKCCIYSQRFKYCLTFTKPFMIYSERTFLCCSRCTNEHHEHTIRINGLRVEIQTGDLPIRIMNLDHNRKMLLGFLDFIHSKKGRNF